MTELLSALETPSDAELISRVRGGDVAAYGELFERHVEAARRLSRQLVRGPDADDLVSEAFAKVLQVLQNGGGPDVAFRAYLLTSVRRLHVDRVRAASRLQTTDDMSQFDPGVPFQDTAVAGFENGAAAKAFASLPERWQLVLWHLEVEGQKPADIAPMLGMSANSVSALAYRAREGLRQAFLTMHLSDISETECRWVNEHLGGYVRKGLSKRDATKVEAHLDGCRRCMAMYLELTEVNSNLRAIIGPLLLGGAATGYLASGGSAGAGGLFGLVSKVKETVAANVSTATAGAVAAGVAAAAVAGFAVMQGINNGTDTVVGADRPIAVGTPAVPGGPTPTAGTTDGAPQVEVGDSLTPGESTVDDPPGTPLESPAIVGPLVPGVIGPGTDPDGQPGGGPVTGPDTGPDGPGSQPGDGPGAQPGDGPGTEPGGEPGTGPGTEPGGEPGSQPTAGPGQPGTEPGGQPGTNPSEPGTGTPSPSDNPSETPTEPGGEPTEGPGDSEPPSGPTTVSTDLSITGTPVATSASLTVSVAGSPIPDQVKVALRGDFGGIRFSKSAQCDVDASGTSAVCTPLPDITTAGSAAVRASGAPGAAFIMLPWTVPDQPKSYRFTVDVAVVGNYVDPDPDNNSLPVSYTVPDPDPEPTAPEHDFEVTSLTASEEVAARTFDLTATVGALPKGLHDASFAVVGATPISATGPDSSSTCEVSDARLTCSGLPDERKFDLTIRVIVPNTGPHNVTVAISVPQDYSEPDGGEGNNTSPVVTLDPKDQAPTDPPAPHADLKLITVLDDKGNSGKGTVDVKVDGVPAGAKAIVTASYNCDDIQVTDGRCDESGSGSLTRAYTGKFSLELRLVNRAGGATSIGSVTFSVTAEGYAEDDPINNVDTVTLKRFPNGILQAGSGIESEHPSLVRWALDLLPGRS